MDGTSATRNEQVWPGAALSQVSSEKVAPESRFLRKYPALLVQVVVPEFRKLIEYEPCCPGVRVRLKGPDAGVAPSPAASALTAGRPVLTGLAAASSGAVAEALAEARKLPSTRPNANTRLTSRKRVRWANGSSMVWLGRPC